MSSFERCPLWGVPLYMQSNAVELELEWPVCLLVIIEMQWSEVGIESVRYSSTELHVYTCTVELHVHILSNSTLFLCIDNLCWHFCCHSITTAFSRMSPYIVLVYIIHVYTCTCVYSWYMYMYVSTTVPVVLGKGRWMLDWRCMRLILKGMFKKMKFQALCCLLMHNLIRNNIYTCIYMYM